MANPGTEAEPARAEQIVARYRQLRGREAAMDNRTVHALGRRFAQRLGSLRIVS